MSSIVTAIVFSLFLVSCSFGQQFSELDGNKNQKLEYAEFEGLFNMYDLDGNSEVSQAEVMTKAGLTQAQVLGVFKVYDINGDGRVDMFELRNLFSKFDINGDGSVSQTEYNQHAKDVQSTGK